MINLLINKKNTLIYPQNADIDHSYKMANQKKRVTGSKKIGCPAAVYMREVVTFPEYKVSI